MKTLINSIPVGAWLALILLAIVTVTPQIGPMLIAQEVSIRHETAVGCQEETWRVPTATVTRHGDDIYRAIDALRAEGKKPMMSSTCADFVIGR